MFKCVKYIKCVNKLNFISYTPFCSPAQVNIVNIGTVATEIYSASMDNVLATGVTATLLASDGV